MELIHLNTVWIVLAAAMVLLMEGGFSLLEAGLVRTKNAVNVTMKIFVDLTIGALSFWVVGFAIMFGADAFGLFGTSLFGAPQGIELGLDLPAAAFVLFQMGFAIACISIISGAVAERMNFKAYIIIAILVTMFVYPISGHWVWHGDGWLAALGMKDFAGSAVIHAMGGFAALAIAWKLGARRGRFTSDGGVNVFAPSNIPLASAGAFLLWFGWFAFNAGSTLDASDASLATIALNTMLAAAAGGTSSLLFTMFKFGKTDPSMTINGSLSGLVAITAGCAFVDQWSAIIIGLIAGIIVIGATLLVDNKLRIDDPVGAVAVHGFNGFFGTVVLGLLDTEAGLLTTGETNLFFVQLLGAVVISAWGFVGGLGVAYAADALVGLRATVREEEEGLDMAYHGIPAYNELERFTDLPKSLYDFQDSTGVDIIQPNGMARKG
ncbi:ammonium transporter [Desulfuribacillus stibiiarsenatis]|uniref:Ammonium transporter n=1 Tax=Desulfuribacillus stibiiarsenatis TaxID=1390249 RepID=A0A1E5L641_9FIRM|nr:ammonium transporter [Desulfuribacillus stibiiarsenatis]OEH85595.1 ammonium transporter [Desulfuribacillus stibiiarsenatis]